MSDDLAQELIKAQAVERMAKADHEKAAAVHRIARQNVEDLHNEIGRRMFGAAGFVVGSTVFRTKDRPGREFLYGGIAGRSGSGTRVLIHKKTVSGKWFKNTTELYGVVPSDLEILRHEGGGK
jgi:hypothetical protein